MPDPPILINCRDRVTPLRTLVDWLERAGHERITLLDNASTYPPLLEYYEQTPHDVVRFSDNLGSRSLWEADIVPAEPFIYTDPDVIPVEECPLDAVARLLDVLGHYQVPKVGLGLYLEDVPLSLKCLPWERGPEINGEIVEAGVRHSLIDTTFAAYPADCRDFLFQGMRTTFPYVARHVSWYVTEPDVEERFYLDHAISGPAGSSWKQELTGRVDARTSGRF